MGTAASSAPPLRLQRRRGRAGPRRAKVAPSRWIALRSGQRPDHLSVVQLRCGKVAFSSEYVALELDDVGAVERLGIAVDDAPEKRHRCCCEASSVKRERLDLEVLRPVVSTAPRQLAFELGDRRLVPLGCAEPVDWHASMLPDIDDGLRIVAVSSNGLIPPARSLALRRRVVAGRERLPLGCAATGGSAARSLRCV